MRRACSIGEGWRVRKPRFYWASRRIRDVSIGQQTRASPLIFHCKHEDHVVAPRFDHVAARPSQGIDDGYGPDPHLHTHVVIANITLRPDGAWRGLDPVEIYRSQSFATAVYRSELARNAQSLGYAIEGTGADWRWQH